MIGFHRDVSCKTMQVPLNLETDYREGRVLYAAHDGFLAPARTPGSYTVHDKRVAHGVTALKSGLRYSLFLQTSRPHLALQPAAA